MGKIEKAMILAAGFGERARPLSLVRPKPLFPVLNRPLIARALDSLVRAGITEAVINIHHLADKMEDWLSGLTGGPVIRPVREKDILGTGGGVGNAAPWLKDSPFILINADIMTDIDLAEAAAAHEASGALATLVLHDRPEFNQVPVSGNGVIIGFRGRGLESVARDGNRLLAFTGIHVVEPEVLNHIPDGPGDIIAVYQSLIDSGALIKAHLPSGRRWWDAGTLPRYLEIHGELLAGAPGGPFLAAESAEVEQGASLEGWACLGEGAVVESGAVVRNSVLWPGARVLRGVTVDGCVLADGVTVRNDVRGQAVTGGAHA